MELLTDGFDVIGITIENTIFKNYFGDGTLTPSTAISPLTINGNETGTISDVLLNGCDVSNLTEVVSNTCRCFELNKCDRLSIINSKVHDTVIAAPFSINWINGLVISSNIIANLPGSGGQVFWIGSCQRVMIQSNLFQNVGAFTNIFTLYNGSFCYISSNTYQSTSINWITNSAMTNVTDRDNLDWT